MTTYNHTPVTSNAAANSSVINAPLAQLDAAIGDLDALGAGTNPYTSSVVAFLGMAALRTTQQKIVPAINELLDDTDAAELEIDALQLEVTAARGGYDNIDSRLDAMVLGSGIVSTQANGAANAGQKVVTVDSTTGFLAGAYVGYLLNGTTIEYNQIDTVDSGTQLTLITNIGTGGILNNGYIQVVSLEDYYGDVTFGSVFVGDGTPSGNGSVLIVNEALSGAINIEGVRDESVLTSGTALSMYASFDAAPTVGGTTTYDHYHAFQARPTYSSSGTVSRLASFWSEPDLDGNVTNLYHLHVKDPTGSGTVAVQTGIRIEDLTQGAENYSLYSAGSGALMYNAGIIQSSSRIFTSAGMDAATLRLSGAGATVGAGILEVDSTGTGDLKYGILALFAYTGLLDTYGMYNYVGLENGQTSGSNSVYGTYSYAGMTGLSGDCYAAAIYGGYYRLSFNSAVGNTVTALTATTLRAEAPSIAGVGTITLGGTIGVSVENQGTAKATTSYGIKIESQSGAGTNYALHTSNGNVLFNSGGDASSDFTVESDSYDALVIDASENSIAIMNNAGGKVGFFGTSPIAKPLLATGAGATVDNVITVLQNLGLVKQS